MTPWRSDLSSLYPEADVEQRATPSPPPRGSLLGVRSSAPAVAATAPAAAATPSRVAADANPTGAPSLLPERNATSAPVSPFLCAVLGCDRPRAGERYCEPHDEAYRTRAYDLTRDVGRGDLP